MRAGRFVASGGVDGALAGLRMIHDRRRIMLAKLDPAFRQNRGGGLEGPVDFLLLDIWTAEFLNAHPEATVEQPRPAV